MPHSRIPTGIAVLQLCLRIIALLSALGCFNTTVYIAVSFSRTNPLLYVALFWVIALDNAEILALTSHPGDGIKRLGLWGIMILEGLGLVLFLISFFVAFMGQFGESFGKTKGAGPGRLLLYGNEPGAKYMGTQWFLVFAIM
jgi:hypothetical protein